MSDKKKYISASRLKTLENCSQLYWAKYHTDLPDKGNDGARRGTICHHVLEYLQLDKHRSNYDRIIEGSNLEADAAITRLVKRKVVLADMDNNDPNIDNYELIKKMILVGLKQDFFCTDNNGKLGQAEQDFLIESKDPEYVIKGYIDKHALYDKGKTLKIIDYKSSKKKFSKQALDGEGQAMMYVLAARTLWPKAKRTIFNFMFLKFPKAPIQELEFTEEQINGFEHYVSSQYKLVNNFTEKDGQANYAADNRKNSWLCSAGKTWVCPLKYSLEYYVLLDKDSRVLQSSYEDDMKPKKGQTVEVRKWDGCPRWKNQAPHSPAQESDDPFEF
jgi:ATP-dependent helicase/DNAse subunit B